MSEIQEPQIGKGEGQEKTPPEGISPAAAQEAPSLLGRLKDIASIAQSLVITVSILIGGAWFLLRGEASPRLNVSQAICHRQLNDQWTWVNVAVSCQNVGHRPLVLESGIIRIQKILPLDQLITKFFEEGTSPVSPTELRVIWPELGSHETKWDLRIEPGETHRSTYDFIIPNSIKTVKIYSAFTNPEEDDFCWSETTIYDLQDQGGKK